ncbi:MAG TPA: ADP/ATP-dependent (S)-NAD(P)H-hydrate dehydratase [Acidimicrobiales bacterium]|nr:ADP/ATP-dependent (S)-NAD(P)H-hydrate dehydratase [Acidimicrobiales bacterium]
MKPSEELLAGHPLPDAAEGSKDDKGHALVIGGPPTCPGGVVLAATAALRAGAGRVQVVVDPAVAGHVAVTVPEVAAFAWDQQSAPPADVVPLLAGADAVLVGPGHACLDDTVVRSVADSATGGTLILDAGALGCAFALGDTGRVVIAPNPSEAARLLDRDGDEERLARALGEKLSGPVAVRGACTVIADGDECYRFDASPPGLGTPGSGDVFMGVLAALIAGGCPAAAALGWAVHLHASAGHRLAEHTPAGYLASDLVRELPFARAALRST